MDLKDAIEKRYSCRSYLNKDVSWIDILRLLNAAVKAPSAGNLQNWRFIIVSKEEQKAKIAQAALNQTWMNQAPIFIILCSDQKTINKIYKERGELYSTQNCAVATENILLTATSLGLATCFVSAFDEEKLRIALRIPDDARPECIITLGYAKEKPPIKHVYGVENFTFFNEYGKKERDIEIFPVNKNGKLLEKAIDKTKASSKELISKIKK